MNFDQASQDAQAQGQARTADYTNKANNYAGDYANYQTQANAANQNIQNQNAYMSGAGSANNLYSNAFNTQAGQTGYDQKALQAAQAGLTNAVGTQAAFNDFANQAASKWGLNAGGLAAANAGATQGLNNNIASQGGALAAQQKAFEQAQTGANQQTGLNLQQQQAQLQGYQNAFDAASKQQQTAQANMQFYENLAQQQGGLTAQQVQAYQNSKALSAQAQASLAAAQDSIAHAQQLTYQTQAQKAADDAAKLKGQTPPPASQTAPGTNSGDYQTVSYQNPADMAKQQQQEKAASVAQNPFNSFFSGAAGFAQSNPVAGALLHTLGIHV